MPRPTTTQLKPKRSIEVVRRALPPDDDLDGENEMLDLDLLRAIDEVEGVHDAVVRIYRQGVHGRDLTYIDEVPPANFNLNMLKHPPYNGGKFRVRVCNADGTFIKNALLQIEPAPKAPEAPLAPPAPPPNNNSEAFVLLAKAMTDGFSRIGELIANNRAVPTPPRSTEQILQELTMMKSLFAQPATQTDPIELITKLLGVMKELPSGGDGGEPGPMAVLLELAKQFGPKLVEAMDQAEPINVPRGAPATRLPPPVGQPRAAMPPQPERKPDVNLFISQQLKFLVRQAKNGNDSEPYAVMVLDNVPPQVLDSFLKRPDWFEEICRYVPDAAPFKDWFVELKACIDDYLTPEPEGEQTVGELATDGPADGTAATGNGKPDTPNT
jgi:hypothetical protein